MTNEYCIANYDIDENGNFIGNIPDGVTIVYFDGRDVNIKNLANLPPFVEELKIVFCYDIESLDLRGATGLKKLSILGSNISNFDNMSPSLEELSFNLCESLESVDLKSATGLKKFVANNSAIKTLNNLPESLRELDLSWCLSLESLDFSSAKNLEKINLSFCNNLNWTLESASQIIDIERQNRFNPEFQLNLPDNFEKKVGFDEIMISLINSYKEFYQSNEDFRDKEPTISDSVNYPLLQLFKRFIFDQPKDGNNLKEPYKNAIPVVAYIAKNPQTLEFINESAKTYLAGCVNQPVAGFTEIACLLNIHKQPDIPSKLESVKILMAIEKIKSEIKNIENTDGSKVRVGVEVELANAMLREVSNKLLLDGVIQKPFPGIPGLISNEHIIESFLTPNNINQVSEKVKQIINQPLKEIVEYVCESSLQDFWAKMVLTKEEIICINQPVQESRKAYLDGDCSDELLQILRETEFQAKNNLLSQSKAKTRRYLNNNQSGELGEVIPEPDQSPLQDGSPTTTQQQNQGQDQGIRATQVTGLRTARSNGLNACCNIS